jgi:hypothetical protein
MNSTSTPSIGGDGVGVGDRFSGLDLHHAERFVVGPVQRSGVESELAGPVVGGDATVAGRRVAQVG